MNQTTRVNNPCEYTYCPHCAIFLGAKKERGKIRRYCLQCNWTYYPSVPPGVAAIITKFDSDDNLKLKVLMIKRHKNNYWGTWGFPAGFVELGEHPETAISRKVKEETRLTTVFTKFFKFLSSPDNYRDSKKHLTFFYHVVVSGIAVNADPEENSEVDWIDISEPIEPRNPDNPIQIGCENHRKVFEMIRIENRIRHDFFAHEMYKFQGSAEQKEPFFEIKKRES